MVLCAEVVNAGFARALTAFLEAGGYEARERAEGRREFYRLHKPKDETYPFMLELFPGAPDTDATVSLSAILLDKDYHSALIASRRTIDGVHVLDQTLLIPFKACAFVDLMKKRADGDTKVKGDDIKKHRNDVFRLLQIFPANAMVDVTEPLTAALRSYIDLLSGNADFDPSSFKMPFDRDEGLRLLQSICQL